jgi:cobalt-zinc-cadmium efflux system protein
MKDEKTDPQAISHNHVHSHEHAHSHTHEQGKEENHAHDHGDDHDHAHGHGHHHHHVSIPKNITRAFVIGIVLNSVFVIMEVATGLFTHSLALLTDAGHNLGDVASLALALLATRFALKKASTNYTFGFKQSTVLVALLNAGVLLLAMGAIAWEAIQRLTEGHAPEIQSKPVIFVATAGIIINTVVALFFMKDKEKDLNMRGAYLHMASDAMVSLGVVIGNIVMLYTHWYWLDAIISLVIVVIIVYGTWDLLRESLRLSLNGVPRNVNMDKLRNFLKEYKGITEVHDLHVWAMSTTENALTVHLTVPQGVSDDHFYEEIRQELKHHFNIGHSTIQVEGGHNQFHCEQKC